MLSNMDDRRGIDVNYGEKRTSVLIPLVYKEKERGRRVEGIGVYVLNSEEASGLGLLELLAKASDEIIKEVNENSRTGGFSRYDDTITKLFHAIGKLDPLDEETKKWSIYTYRKVKNGEKVDVDLKGIFGADRLMREGYPFAAYIGLSNYDPRIAGFDFDIVTMGNLRELYREAKELYERVARELENNEEEYRKINQGLSKLFKRKELKRLEEEIAFGRYYKNRIENELKKYEQIFREVEELNF